MLTVCFYVKTKGWLGFSLRIKCSLKHEHEHERQEAQLGEWCRKLRKARRL